MLVLPALLAGGCATRQPYVNEQRLEKGLVLVYTGIEGRSPFNDAICRGLADGGVDCAIELVDWTVHVPGAYLVNLRAEERNREKARELAGRIALYQAQYPGRPVVLVGQSGGAAVAVWTAEELPLLRKVDGLVLLAAALSPEYMLDLALFKTRRGIVNFHSDEDWFFLMLGTTVFGTMDGQHGVSAGKAGFDVLQPAIRPYDRLYQIAWHRDMAPTGHRGIHLTSGAAGFVSRYVAPLVQAPAWDPSLVRRVCESATQPATQPTSLPADAIPGLRPLQ